MPIIRLKHHLAYKEMWQTTEEAPALSRGTLFHSVMESHYGFVMKWQERYGMNKPLPMTKLVDAVVQKHLYDPHTGAQTEEQELVEWMYRGYCEAYGDDATMGPTFDGREWKWKIIAIEQRHELWLPTERGTRSTFKLAGTVDLLVQDYTAGGGLWIVDHKTCKNLPKQKDFDMEDQTGIYTYLKQRSGVPVRGAIYNHVRTNKLVRPMEPEERFKRTRTVRTESELRTMALEALEEMRDAYRPRKWASGDPPRTPDGERCGWKCGYTEPCLAGRKSGPAKLRAMLEDTGFYKADHKPGPTFAKKTPKESG